MEVGAGGWLANGSGRRRSSHNEFFWVVSDFFFIFTSIGVKIKYKSDDILCEADVAFLAQYFINRFDKISLSKRFFKDHVDGFFG